MGRVKIKCYEIPIEYGNHALYILSTSSEKAADLYIKKRFGLEIEHPSEEECGAYFVGHGPYLFLFLPPGTELDYVVHEIEHIYCYMITRMSTKPDEEGAAYMKQMLFKKIIDKLVEVGLVKIIYYN